MTTEDNIKDEILNVGIVGHIDHGKTTLLQKLSGKWTDTHSEELKRGITIKLGYAEATIYEDNGEYNIQGKGKKLREVSFIDAPGHEMLMATMLSGAALIDAAVLVIAVNEGIKPQTKEHLMALQAKGIKNLIVVQSKLDLADEAGARKSYEEIKNFIKGKYENIIIIPVSAQQSINVDAIWKALSEIKIPQRDNSGEPIFVVARSFDINKPGTEPKNLHGAVLGGTLKKGVLKVGDEIELKPGRIVKEMNKSRYENVVTKIASLFRSNKKVDKLTPGGSASIETELDMVFGKSDALAGNILSLSGKLPAPVDSIKLEYKLFPDVEVFDKPRTEVRGTLRASKSPTKYTQGLFDATNSKEKKELLKHSEMILLSINTSLTGGTISSIKDDKLEISLKKPVIAFKGDNVGIARSIEGHWRLIGSGIVI